MTSTSNGQKKDVKVTVLPTTTRFKDMVNLREGTSIRDAIRRADQNLSEHRQTAMAAMSEEIEKLRVIAGHQRRAPNPEYLRRLYLLSNDIYAMAATFNQTELSEAAYSLCELIGGHSDSSAPDTASLDVHVNSIFLLNQNQKDTDMELRRSIIEGLKKVSGSAK